MGSGSFNLPIQTGSSSAPEYIRNPEWISLPDAHSTFSEWIGIYAIFNNTSNLASVQFSVTGGYTVDWGDGVVENVATNTKRDHAYTFSSISALTETSDGYRQVIIRVYPQNTANHFTAVSMQARHSSHAFLYNTGWLDINLRTTSACTTFVFHQLSNAVTHGLCKRFNWVGTFGGTSLSRAFNAARSLQYVHMPNITSCNTYANCFDSCIDLLKVEFGTIGSTSCVMTSMFSSCTSMYEAPLFDTSKSTNITSMFNSCYSLQIIPVFDFSLVTTATGFVQFCYSLKTFPAINFPVCTTFASFFSNCSSLENIELIGTGAGSNFSSMFSSCTSLITIPEINTVSATNMANMFENCYSLEYTPNFNTPSLTGVNSMFNQCLSIRKIGTINLINVVAPISFLSGCNGLREFGGINMISNYVLGFSGVVSPMINITEMEKIFLEGLGSTPSTIGIATSYAANVSSNFNKTSCSVAGIGTIAAVPNTSSLSIGMCITGTTTGPTTGVAISLLNSGSQIVFNNHGLPSGTMVSFSGIVTTTGLTANKIYYVINPLTNSFQISETLGGSQFSFSNDGSAQIKYMQKVVSFVTNTSVTTDTPFHNTGGALTLSFRTLNQGIAIMKGWTITG